MKTRELSIRENQAILSHKNRRKSIRAIAQALDIIKNNNVKCSGKKRNRSVLTTRHQTGRQEKKTTADHDRNIVKAVKSEKHQLVSFPTSSTWHHNPPFKEDKRA